MDRVQMGLEEMRYYSWGSLETLFKFRSYSSYLLAKRGRGIGFLKEFLFLRNVLFTVFRYEGLGNPYFLPIGSTFRPLAFLKPL